MLTVHCTYYDWKLKSEVNNKVK